MSHFSTHVKMRGLCALEQFFNPLNTFREVHIVALGDDLDYRERQFGTLYLYPVPSVIRASGLRLLNNAYLVIAGILQLARLVKNYRIDLIVQIEATPLKFGIPAVAVAKRTGTPSIITLCNDYRNGAQSYSPLLQWGTKFLWRFLFRNCTKVRSKSAYIAEFAYSHGVPQEKVRVIPNKEILDRFRTRPDDDELEQMAHSLGIVDLIKNSVVFLTVAWFKQAKNLERQLRAFALACQHQPNLVYLIVGQGPLRSELEALAQRLGISERVRFLGTFSHDQLRCIYHLSDVLLFATLYEGQPRVIIEAMLSHLPVICANYGEVCQIVEDDCDGVWVDPLDIQSITQAVLRLGTDDTLRAQMSQHRKFDAQRFSLERVSRQEADLYLSVISEAYGRGAWSHAE